MPDERSLPELLDELRLMAYGHHRIPQADQLALLDLAEASERRRQAEEDRNQARGDEARAFYTDRIIDATHEVNAALVALEACLRGERHA